MRLTSVQSRLFRNIVDSGPIKIEPDVTCLVGQNESGKTALLASVYRFNPVYNDTFNREQDYPRWRLIRRSSSSSSKVQRTGSALLAVPLFRSGGRDGDPRARCGHLTGLAALFTC